MQKPIVAFNTSGLDPTFKAHALRGIGRHVAELWKRLPTLAADAPFSLVPFSHQQFRTLGVFEKLVEHAPCGKHTLRQQIIYPLQLALGALRNTSVLHFPAHVDAPSWCPKNTVVTVHDLIPLVCKDLYKNPTNSWRFNLARSLELRAIRAAKLIFTVSEASARDLQSVLQIPPEMIVITPNGVEGAPLLLSAEEKKGVRAEWHLPEAAPLALYVGGIDPRKNWSMLLEIVAAIPEMHLVMVGKIAGDDQYPKFCARREALGIGERVHSLGYVPDEALDRLYAVSALSLFPSLYEGFGLPPLESLVRGVPVVSSNSSAMPEVVGQAGILCHPEDATAFIQATRLLLASPEKCDELRTLGLSQAKKFSWDTTAEKTIAGYELFLRRSGALS